MHPLLVAQLEEARSSDGTVDLTRLTQLVSATYHAADESGQGKSLPARRPPGVEAAAVIGLEELRAINARLHLALDNMSQGLCLYDEQDRVLFVSRRMATILGLPEGAIQAGMTFEEVVRQEMTANLFEKRPIAEILRERRALLEEPDQQKRILGFNSQGRYIVATYLRIPSGGWVKTVSDITRERVAEAQAEANARLAAVGEMAAGLAHELRQPLTTLVLAATNASRLAERGDMRGTVEKLEKIIAQGMRASDLIEHLRQFARGWDTAQGVVPVQLAEAVDGARILVGNSLKEDGIAIALELGEPPPIVLGRKLAIEQVLVNLLMNARDALSSLPPGRDRRVRLTVSGNTEEIELRVADTGGGIPAEIMPRIFQPFVTSKGPDRGTGLGLSICRGLMSTIGGSISVTNEAEGACFLLRFRRPTD